MKQLVDNILYRIKRCIKTCFTFSALAVTNNWFSEDKINGINRHHNYFRFPLKKTKLLTVISSIINRVMLTIFACMHTDKMGASNDIFLRRCLYARGTFRWSDSNERKFFALVRCAQKEKHMQTQVLVSAQAVYFIVYWELNFTNILHPFLAPLIWGTITVIQQYEAFSRTYFFSQPPYDPINVEKERYFSPHQSRLWAFQR